MVWTCFRVLFSETTFWLDKTNLFYQPMTSFHYKFLKSRNTIITTWHASAWKTMAENGFSSLVPFCLRSPVCFERCVYSHFHPLMLLRFLVLSLSSALASIIGPASHHSVQEQCLVLVRHILMGLSIKWFAIAVWEKVPYANVLWNSNIYWSF